MQKTFALRVGMSDSILFTFSDYTEEEYSEPLTY